MKAFSKEEGKMSRELLIAEAINSILNCDEVAAVNLALELLGKS
jgi:hypothetical protein